MANKIIAEVPNQKARFEADTGYVMTAERDDTGIAYTFFDAGGTELSDIAILPNKTVQFFNFCQLATELSGQLPDETFEDNHDYWA